MWHGKTREVLPAREEACRRNGGMDPQAMLGLLGLGVPTDISRHEKKVGLGGLSTKVQFFFKHLETRTEILVRILEILTEKRFTFLKTFEDLDTGRAGYAPVHSSSSIEFGSDHQPPQRNVMEQRLSNGTGQDRPGSGRKAMTCTAEKE